MSYPSDAMKALLQSATNGFALNNCRDCGHRFYTAQSFCATCLSPNVVAEADTGEATVLSTTRIHRSLDPVLAPVLPLHVACVRTTGGQRVFAMADRLLSAGTRVRLQLREGLFHAQPTPFESPPP